jgi:hypothetical protein
MNKYIKPDGSLCIENPSDMSEDEFIFTMASYFFGEATAVACILADDESFSDEDIALLSADVKGTC